MEINVSCICGNCTKGLPTSQVDGCNRIAYVFDNNVLTLTITGICRDCSSIPNPTNQTLEEIKRKNFLEYKEDVVGLLIDFAISKKDTSFHFYSSALSDFAKSTIRNCNNPILSNPLRLGRYLAYLSRELDKPPIRVVGFVGRNEYVLRPYMMERIRIIMETGIDPITDAPYAKN